MKNQMNRAAGALSISVIVAVYNEEDVLPRFHARLGDVLDSMSADAEIIYVNDGSTDSSLEIMHRLQARDKRIGIIDLSRNFGKEIAMTAGLDHAKGDAVIVIDADLQEPPELIPELLSHLSRGYDVAYAKRSKREGSSILKRATAAIFYQLMQFFGQVRIPANTGDYRAMSRRAVEAVKQLRERHRFMKGLFAWIGFPQKAVPYVSKPRQGGRTKWSYWKLWNLAIEGITSHTMFPLKLSTWLGIFVALCALIYAVVVIVKTLVFGEPVRGYPTIVVLILFLGGVQLFCIGIIGEYLGRTFDEGKQRPLYLIREYTPASKPVVNRAGIETAGTNDTEARSEAPPSDETNDE
jgi:glycosyltransferase involved in cell wall biosynthesis